MAAGNSYPYLAVFTIDGVKHVTRGYTPSEDEMKLRVRHIVDSRNVTVETEKAEVRDDDMIFNVSEEQAQAIIKEVSDANPNDSRAGDLHATPNMLLHKSVADLKSEKESAAVDDVAGELK
jgi:hypothetical protein